MEEQIKQAAIDVIIPIIEGSMILAAHYTKCAGRNTVSAMDLEYAIKYMAQHKVGELSGSLFPEIYDSESDSETDVSECSEDDEPFSRIEYTTDEWCSKMNTAFDTWNSWQPSCIAEQMLKGAIEKNLCPV